MTTYSFQTAFLTTVSIIRRPQTQVDQQLGKLEAYVYASFEIHPWGMTCIISLLHVPPLPYAGSKNDVS